MLGQSPLAFIAKIVGGTAITPGVVGKQGELWDGQRHAPGYAAAYSGVVGMVSSSAGRTLSAALATTYTGLCLSNPAGSGKNLVLLRASGVLNVAPAALTAVLLATGYVAGGVTVHTTPETPLSAFVGTGPALVGLADAACTLVGTPAYSQVLSETPAATSVLAFDRPLDGSIILPPGAWAAIVSTIAGPAAGLWASMIWEEVAP